VAQEHDACRIVDAVPARGAWGSTTDQTAQGIRPDLIEEALDLVLDQLTNAPLATGHAWGLTEAAKQVDVHGDSPVGTCSRAGGLTQTASRNVRTGPVADRATAADDTRGPRRTVSR
jgi:hypothetical protein